MKERDVKKQLFAERRPYLYVALIEVVMVLVYLLAGTIAHFLQLSNQGLYGLANFTGYGLFVMLGGDRGAYSGLNSRRHTVKQDQRVCRTLAKDCPCQKGISCLCQ
jgi:hypothetical protein